MNREQKRKKNQDQWLDAVKEAGSVKEAAQKLDLTEQGFFYHVRNFPEFKRRYLETQRDLIKREIEAIAV